MLKPYDFLEVKTKTCWIRYVYDDIYGIDGAYIVIKEFLIIENGVKTLIFDVNRALSTDDVDCIYCGSFDDFIKKEMTDGKVIIGYGVIGD